MPPAPNSKTPHRSNWNLLICGPIEHGGYVQAGNVEGGLLKKATFDCTDTIIKNVTKWGHQFETIKLITWSNQAELIKPELKKLNIDIHFLDDPGRQASFCGDSRVRVATATAEGTRLIRNRNTNCLRIRSDQSFDIGKMLKCHEKNDQIIQANQAKIGALLPHISGLCFWLDRPYSLCNYAHAGKTDALQQFAEAQIQYRYASALAKAGWPEGDTIRKHLFSLRSELNNHGFHAYHCFPALPKSLTEGNDGKPITKVPWETLRLWDFSLRHLYSVASKKTMATLEWKGERYPHPDTFGNGMRFRSDWLACTTSHCKPMRDYCKAHLKPWRSPSWRNQSWFLHQQAELICGSVEGE